MRTYLLNLWDALRTSYWFVPSLLATVAAIMAIGMPLLDQSILQSETNLPEWVRTTPDTARSTLSATAGAMIGVTGTVFSITIVTLSLTSQQFGPRLLRRFMYDLTTQMTLGVFLSTGFYCLVMLRVVESQEGGLSAPHLSVIAAVGLTVLSMIMLIVFIHHIAMLIQAPNVVAAVADDLDDAIVRLFPEKLGEPASEDNLRHDQFASFEETESRSPLRIRSNSNGYVQAIDVDGLMDLAREKNLSIQLSSKPGDFLAVGTPLANVWFQDERAPSEEVRSSLHESLDNMFITGTRRTPRQDVECAVDELVEIAVRSLSPGINDPFTAINCVDHLGAALGRLAERKLPSAYRCDEEGKLRVVADPVTFPDVLDAAFNQIRQYGRDSVAVTVRLLEAFTSIARHVSRAQDAEALLQHGEMVAAVADSLPQQRDRDVIRERLDTLRKAIYDSTS